MTEPVAYGVFADIDGKLILQHPVRFTFEDAERDCAMYAPGTKLCIKPLGVIETDAMIIPEAPARTCNCKKSDAWRCAREQSLRTVACHCACHRRRIL